MLGRLSPLFAACLFVPLTTSVAAQTTLRAWKGPTTGDLLGSSLANIGDVDLDGVDDFALGMPGDDTFALDSGAVRLVSGATSRILRTHYGHAALGRFGTRVARLGDVDGDGRPEYVTTETGISTSSWTICVLSSLTGARLWEYVPPAPEAVGSSLVVVGDVDADGVVDLALGTGTRVRILSGTNGAVLRIVDGPPTFFYFGASISPAGDLDQDGHDDFWTTPVENFWSYTPTQHVQARSGLDGHLLFEISPPQVFGEFGPMTVVGGNDLNGDSIPDVIVSARDGGGQYHGAGHVYAYSGANSALLWSRVGANNAVSLGISMFAVGDVDGDGRTDAAASDSGFYATSLLLLSGANGATIGSVLPPGGSKLSEMCAAGDVDGDGRGDFVIGGYTQTSAGSVITYGPGEVHVRTLASVALKADRFDVVHGAGGAQALTLDFGVAFANRPYRLLGSRTGTTPGIPTSVGPIPLTPDAYFVSILNGTAGILPVPDRGTLDANGRASATFTLPPAYPTFASGNIVRHAAVVLNPVTRAVEAFSRAVPLCIVDDPCSAAIGATDDCDGNGMRDGCQSNLFPATDCNKNARPDACDLAQGLDGDCDANGVPDKCQADCNQNQRPDVCDLALGSSADCNLDGIPDECYVYGGDWNQNGVPDACEITTRYVDDDAPLDPAPGSTAGSDPLENGSLAHPFDSLAEALAASNPLDEIVIEDGLYTGPQNRSLMELGRAGRVRSRNGPATCVFDLEYAGAFVHYSSGYLTLDLYLEGITIRRAGAAGVGNVFPRRGNTVIRNCRFLDGQNNICAGLSFGGMPQEQSILVDRCVFARNVTTSSPPRSAALEFSSCYGSVVVRDCLFADNVGAPNYGSISVEAAQVTFDHCTIVGTMPGGTAIVRIQSSTSGGQVPAHARFQNSIVRSSSSPFWFGGSASAHLEYSNIQSGAASVTGFGTAGPDVYDTDPSFVNATGGDYHLHPHSPCIDRGDPLFAPARHQFDGDGEPRIARGRTDIGWDEVP